jgi:histidine ammonia-lyase
MVKIGFERLVFKDLEKILKNDENIEIDDRALEKVEQSYLFLERFSKDKIIYGINTGFGPMAQYRISEKDQIQLQYNLIRSHASGSGELLPEKCVRLAMISRLNTLLKGYSGVNTSVVLLLRDFINFGIYPHIYKHGGVGASGDLVQLSHLALALIGEGKVMYKGSERNTVDVLGETGLNPIDIKIREGLALINGTSVMTGINSSNVIHSEYLLNWSIMISSMINEMVRSYEDHFSAELNQVKLHEGQQYVAKTMRAILSESRLTKKRHEHLYSGNGKDVQVFDEKVQEYYSLRCVPQILGPIYDTIQYSRQILENEINSVNDNPIIDVDHQNVYHGGNFHGDYVSLEADKLKIAVTKLSMLAERQLNFLMNNHLNKILPPFVNLGTLGLNLGMQGVQFTAVSTVAENQSLSTSVYIHSIPNNNDNQDIVSMGTNAALMTQKVIRNTFEVLAVQIMAVVQAIDYLGVQDEMSPVTRNIYQKIRALVPMFKEDQVFYDRIESVKTHIKNNNPL